MSRVQKFVLSGLALVLVLAGGGFYYINKEAIGIPAFYVWKAVSGQSHGGQYAEVNGIRLYYETYGAGSPVLVLHGGTGFIESMHYQIGDLAGDHLVIAADSRGHGRSTDGEGPLHYAQMTDDMVTLLDTLKIEKQMSWVGVTAASSLSIWQSAIPTAWGALPSVARISTRQASPKRRI